MEIDYRTIDKYIEDLEKNKIINLNKVNNFVELSLRKVLKKYNNNIIRIKYEHREYYTSNTLYYDLIFLKAICMADNKLTYK